MATPVFGSNTTTGVHAHHSPHRESAAYQQNLHELVVNLGLSETNMNHEAWATLAQMSTQNVLDDIYSKKGEVIKLLCIPDRPTPDQILRMIKQDSTLRKLPRDQAFSILENKYISLPFTSRERPKDCGRVERKLEERIANLPRDPRYFTTINTIEAVAKL